MTLPNGVEPTDRVLCRTEGEAVLTLGTEEHWLQGGGRGGRAVGQED